MLSENDTKFVIDVSELVGRAVEIENISNGQISISLPYVDIKVAVSDEEQVMANNLMTLITESILLRRLEFTDNNLLYAIASINEIDKLISGLKLDLLPNRLSILSIIFDLINIGIRLFHNLENPYKDEMIRKNYGLAPFEISSETRERYSSLIRILRGHINRCIIQISAIASYDLPIDNLLTKYSKPWPLVHYVNPK
jgi:hypothetical protein